jgi:hypothetical protein
MIDTISSKLTLPTSSTPTTTSGGWGPNPYNRVAQNKAYTALFGISTQEFFNFI